MRTIFPPVGNGLARGRKVFNEKRARDPRGKNNLQIYIYFLPLLVHITLGVGKCLQYYLRTKIYILYTCTSKLLHVPATKSLKRSKRRSRWKEDLFINISQYKIIVHNVQSIIRTAQYLFFLILVATTLVKTSCSFLIHIVKKDKNSQNIYQLISIWQSIKEARSKFSFTKLCSKSWHLLLYFSLFSNNIKKKLK